MSTMSAAFLLELAAATGLHLREQDEAKLRAFVAQRLRHLELPAPDDYARLLRADSAAGLHEREHVVAALTSGESFFFRDHGQFELLRTTLLPELIRRRAGERALRLWSAGCSTGEEAYSLAIVVHELLQGAPDWQLLILGTDLNGAAIDRARRGLYGEWSFRGVAAEVQARYFSRAGAQWQIAEHLRRRTHFRRGDLLREHFPDPAGELRDLDLILCRNVFIYLEHRAVASVLAKMAESLTEGGYLLTGHNELFAHHLGPLHTRIFPGSIAYQRSRARAALPPPADGAPSIDLVAPLPLQRKREEAPVRHPAAQPAPRPVARQPPAPMEQAWAAADRGDEAVARRSCEAAIRQDPLDAAPYYLLAQLEREHGDVERAKSLLRKVIYLDPRHIPAHMELAALHEAAGGSDKARKMRSVAIGLLEALPATTPVPPYEASTAGELLGYLRTLDGADRS